jgi:hypothetical protein
MGGGTQVLVPVQAQAWMWVPVLALAWAWQACVHAQAALQVWLWVLAQVRVWVHTLRWWGEHQIFPAVVLFLSGATGGGSIKPGGQ